MDILVLDVAASESGALSILRQYYADFLKDPENRYILCVSGVELESKGNVTVLKYPWVKRSWLHRLWFEFRELRKLEKTYQPDRALSLQNVLFTNRKCQKWIYLHQTLPYVAIRFKLRENPKLWVYQNVIGKLINASLRRADKVIVQTKWMKEACVRAAKIPPERVEIVSPAINAADVIPYRAKGERVERLFYPATALEYKNHMTLLKAIQIIKDQGDLPDLSLSLTVSGKENPLAEQLRAFSDENRLPVEFLGQLPRSEVMRLYAESTLIFPSYIESFGLPLLEARTSNAPILASDCPFSREILEGYADAAFFDPFDARNCADAITDFFSVKPNGDKIPVFGLE